MSVPLRSPLTRGSSSTISSLFSSFSEVEVLDEAVKYKSAIRSPLWLRIFLFLVASCSCRSIALFLWAFAPSLHSAAAFSVRTQSTLNLSQFAAGLPETK